MTSSDLSFRVFVQSVAATRYEDFRDMPDAKVESGAAFDEMRQHLLDLYKEVEVTHSFIGGCGQIIDCVPTMLHPAVKNGGGYLPTPPPPLGYGSAPPGVANGPAAALPPQLHPDLKDSLGNRMWCPADTLPLPRVTLPQLTRFKRLRDFHSREPADTAHPALPPSARTGSVLADRRYALAFQTIDNIGGSSHVNVWRPFVSVMQESYVQQWYTAASGTVLQTVECGWHVDHQRYHDHDPRLFTYWTRDTYVTGDFNLDNRAFVPNPNANWLPGVGLRFSQAGGQQTEYAMGFFLTGGAWWFHFNGQWLGSYPVSLFRGGPMASHAKSIEFGGEVRTGFSFWPPMGSGALAAAGFGKAAYQRDALVTPVGGSAQQANLTPSPSPGNCYTIDVMNHSSAPWGSFMFFGGPGGSNC